MSAERMKMALKSFRKQRVTWQPLGDFEENTEDERNCNFFFRYEFVWGKSAGYEEGDLVYLQKKAWEVAGGLELDDLWDPL